MGRKINDILFKGYVREPLPMVLLALLVGIAFIVLTIWATVSVCAPLNNDTDTQLLTLIEYEIDGPIYLFLASDGSYYDLPSRAIADSSIIDYLIENKVSVYIEYVPTTERSHDIMSISSYDRMPIVKYSVISEARAVNAKISSSIMWCACVIYWLFIAAVYYFVSNAPQYPKIAALLVRESFRNF